MKVVILLLLSAGLSFAQETPKPGDVASSKPSAEASVEPEKVDPKLHADSVRLVELSGVRQKIQETLPKGIEDGRKKMMEACPTCSPTFGDEWASRMAKSYNLDEFVSVYVKAYEKYLTDGEVLELISLQVEQNAGRSKDPSPELKARLASIAPTMLGEIMGKCTQIGSKLGAQIGGEIQAQHPEYFSAQTNSSKSQ